jgi:predicted dehydrogenase
MTLRLAVVGAGVMGANHARVARSLPGVELVAVVDEDTERAKAAAGPSDALALSTLDDLIGTDGVDAVVLAVPTPAHHPAALACLRAGLHVLVEKPIASTVEQADELIDAAVAADRVLMVGHIERFNPVVMEAMRHLDRPIHIEADRVGPFTDRVKDSVVLDLMIHDLDIVAAFAGAEVSEVSGIARSVRTDSLDLASVHLTFANGVTATVTASRVGQQKIRRLDVTQAESFLSVDLIRQDISINRVAHVEFLAEGGTRYRQTGVVEIPFVENRGEPLAIELGEFTRAIAEGRPPAVDGRQGRTALELVDRVLSSVRVS